MSPSDIATLVFGVIGAVVIFAYYMNSDKSVCRKCQTVISHQKQNRYSIQEGGKSYALCKKCYNTIQKLEALKAQECSCCQKAFSTRMKICEWQGVSDTYYLCVSCNKKANTRVRQSFTLNELLPSTFIRGCSKYFTFEELVEASSVKIISQSDFNSPKWDSFIAEQTTFSSWAEMASVAESQMLSRESDKVISELCGHNV
ncbi:hypothetical protein [Vibrio variabilis]|uniref:hypothetical protein n=1 Tax=Vibrio variabilis TaxID=990271 RepID=UPI000DD9A190|nr:hypothetical protein [Vibrio variabilis]